MTRFKAVVGFLVYAWSVGVYTLAGAGWVIWQRLRRAP